MSTASAPQNKAQSSMIVRRVRVDRARASKEAIAATGRVAYVDPVVVDAMPIGEGEEVDVFIFKPGSEAYDKNGVMSCAELERQFDLRGLKPDPRATTAMNEADPAFADEHPNGSQWKDGDGNYCFEAFRLWGGQPSVCVGRDDDRGWIDGDWSLSGVLK